jgi:hypothetical protein
MPTMIFRRHDEQCETRAMAHLELVPTMSEEHGGLDHDPTRPRLRPEPVLCLEPVIR